MVKALDIFFRFFWLPSVLVVSARQFVKELGRLLHE